MLGWCQEVGDSGSWVWAKDTSRGEETGSQTADLLPPRVYRGLSSKTII